jgi:hypothetical protein
MKLNVWGVLDLAGLASQRQLFVDELYENHRLCRCCATKTNIILSLNDLLDELFERALHALSRLGARFDEHHLERLQARRPLS